jgi:hypothetical protein
MRQITKSEILAWGEAPLFHNCGKSIPDYPMARQIPHSKAIKSLSSSFGKWFTLGLMLNNRTINMIHKSNYERAKYWNDIVDDITTHTKRFVDLAIAKAGLPSEEQIALSINGCLAGALMEVEFSDVTPSIFYEERLRPILLAGNLPCGWDGPKLDTYWAGASTDPVPAGTVLYY